MTMEWVLVIYLAIGGASLLLLIMMMVLGNLDFDLDIGPDIDLDIGDVDGGPGLLSLPIMLSFFAAFGGIGALLTYFEFNTIITPFVAAVSALLLAGLLFMLMRYFFRMFSSDSTVTYSKLKGQKATVTVPINPGMEGQITLFTEQRGRTLVPAVADRKFPNGAKVIIKSSNGDSVNVVSPSEWNRSRSNRKNVRGDK